MLDISDAVGGGSRFSDPDEVDRLVTRWRRASITRVEKEAAALGIRKEEKEYTIIDVLPCFL